MITQFFVVTTTSVYRLEGSRAYHSSATKIAIRGKSKLPVGTNLGGDAHYMIGIGWQLQSFAPEKYGWLHPMTGMQRDFEQVNTVYWGANSSAIVAMFENEAEAAQCLMSADLKPRDPRWIESTRRILGLIGDNHPSFFVSHSKDFGLLEHEPAESVA